MGYVTMLDNFIETYHNTEGEAPHEKIISTFLFVSLQETETVNKQPALRMTGNRYLRDLNAVTKASKTNKHKPPR